MNITVVHIQTEQIDIINTISEWTRNHHKSFGIYYYNVSSQNYGLGVLIEIVGDNLQNMIPLLQMAEEMLK